MNNLFGDAVEEAPVEEEEVSSAPKLFDWLTSINTTKEDLRSKDPALKSFEPFIINKGLSQSEATIGFAAILNRLAHIPKEYQYLFLLNGIPKNRSYAKWAKMDKVDNLKEVMAALGYNADKAKEAIRVLGPEGVKKLLYVKGGKNQ